MGRGISSGTMGIVVMAILAGLVGAYVVRNSLLQVPSVAKTPPTPLTVPLATSDLPAGRVIALGDIALVSMTRDEMKADGILVMETMMSPDQIIGRITKEGIKKGEPFLTTNLYLEGTRRDFTEELRPGYRAIGLTVARDRGGSLPEGTLVDVFFRTTPKASTATERGIPEVTLQLLQGVEIIDVFEPPTPRISAPGNFDIRGPRAAPPPTVTLAVTPDQAQILQTAQGRGELALIARPDTERVTSAGLKPKTLNDILGLQPDPQVVVFATEAYRRGSRSVNVYRNDRLAEELSTQPAPVPPMNVPPASLDPTDDPLGNPLPTVPGPPTPTPPVPAPLNPLPGNAVPANPNPVPTPGLPVPPAPVPPAVNPPAPGVLPGPSAP